VIRPATADDAEAVAGVHVETWRAAYAHALPAEGLASLSVERRADFHRRCPPLVAEVNGEIVGFVGVGPSRETDADGELYAIYVHPDHWATGVGRALIEAGERRLLELGHGEAILWVLEDNPRARRFYDAAGWSADGAMRLVEIFGIEVPEVRYRKTL
jgi:GNAT superfamily N-acetyltransferase